MRKQEVVDEAQGLVLAAKYEQFEWAKRALEEARLELGGVIANVGLSAAARRIDRSRQWCLQLVQAAEEKARKDEEARREGRAVPSPDVADLIESVRRSGILEPLIVGVTDDDTLRIVDGHRRLKAAREAGVTSLPVMLSLIAPEAADELRGPAEEAARGHRRVRFQYARPDGIEALRTVDVWGVVRRAEHAYLIGFDQDRQAARTFRLSRVIGGITFVGEGTPPPEGFSAEASVWGPLDPESLEALEESFRRVLQEQRASAEDEAAGEVVPDGATRTEIDDLHLEMRILEEARARFQISLDNSWVAQHDLLERMTRELNEFMATLAYANKELSETAPSVMEGPPGPEETLQSLAQLRAKSQDWKSELQSLRQAMDETESDEDKRRRMLSRLNALLEST